MPRKSRNQDDTNVESRVTRRSLRVAANADSPQKSNKASTSPAPSPAKRGRGRGRGSSSSTPRSKGKKQDSGDEEDQREHTEDSEVASPSKKGKATASPRGGRGRGKNSNLEAAESDDANEETTPNEPTSTETSPTKSRRTRSPRSKPPTESPSPSRRSSRGAAKAAAEAIESQAAETENAEEEEDLQNTMAKKRKADEEKSTKEKRQKIEETKKESKMETDVTLSETLGKTENAGEGEEKEMAIVDQEAPSQPMQQPSSSQEEQNVNIAEGPLKKVDVQDNAAGIKVDNEEKSSQPEKSVQESVPLTEPDSSTNVEKDEEMETDSVQVETTGEEPASQSKEVKDEIPQKTSNEQQEKKITIDDSVEKLEADVDVPSVKEVGTVACTALTKPVDTAQDNVQDFVIVNKHELPSHESSAVQDILPKSKLPLPDVSVPSSTTTNIEENFSSVSHSDKREANSNHLAKSINIQGTDPLFSRQFICNPHLIGINDSADKQFSVASYNILADCHALRGIHEWGQYKWCTEENLAIAHRQIRLHEELKYLDADILCLQEVSPIYFHDVLLPTLQIHGYDGFFIKREAEDHDEGEASFYRTSRFTLINSQGLVLHKLAEKETTALDISDQTKEVVLNRVRAPCVLLTMQLECKKTGTVVTVGNIHVTWGEFKLPDQQSVQIACAIKEVVSQAGGADKPHIICGDFNSVPTSPGYLLARDGYLADETLAVLQNIKELEVPGQEEKCALVDLWWKGFQHPSNSLKSSYYLAQGREPISSKFPHDGGMRSVDFIWFSQDTLNLHGVLELLPSNLIENGIPNETAPSDHLSTKAVFSLK